MHFGNKHGILVKSRHSRHLTKIMASVISVFINTAGGMLLQQH